MLTAVRATWTLFIGIALIMLGNGLQGTLLGVRASLEGFSTTTTGLVMTGYYLGFLVGSILMPRLVNNVGHIRVFAALASLASSSVLVHTVFVDPWIWMAMRLITGFSYAGLYVVAESWLNERASNEIRGQLLSLYMLVSMGCMMLGQLLLNLAPPQQPELFILTSVLVSLALVPISLTVVQAPALTRAPPIGLRELYRGSPLGVIGGFGTGIANGTLLGMGAVFAAGIGLPIEQVAYFMMAAIFGGMLLQWPIGHLSDRFDRRRVITVVTFLSAISALLALPYVEPPGLALFVLIALFGGLHMPMYSLCIAHTNDHLKPEQMVAASGRLMLIFGCGSSLGPLTAALLMDAMGPGGFFWWLAIGVFALYRMLRRAPTPLADQGLYVPVPPRASPVSAEWVVEEGGPRREQ
jgi:MFS family permease